MHITEIILILKIKWEQNISPIVDPFPIDYCYIVWRYPIDFKAAILIWKCQSYYNDHIKRMGKSHIKHITSALKSTKVDEISWSYQT